MQTDDLLLTRFAIYETVRDQVTKGSEGPLPFYKKVLLGSISGCIGGFVGTPADMVNVRMQNDMKLPQNQRRNYAHALDGLYRVAREEGLKKLFSGATMASSRGMLVTVGQLSCYDQAKQLVLSTGYLSDSIFTHFIASFIAGGCATFLCQPLDVLKTRLMNAKGEYRGVLHCAMETAKLGPLAFTRASCLPVSASCPTPCLRSCFWNSFASTLASKCRPDVAVGAAGSRPAPCASLFQSARGLAAEPCPEPSPCPLCSSPSCQAQDPHPSLPGQPSDRCPLRAAGFTSTSRCHH